jgi:hypothetical protein
MSKNVRLAIELAQAKVHQPVYVLPGRTWEECLVLEEELNEKLFWFNTKDRSTHVLRLPN